MAEKNIYLFICWISSSELSWFSSKTETSLKFLKLQVKDFFFFYLLFGSPIANFGPLPRGQPHSPNVNH